IRDSPTGKHRPTASYVGGLDGQLHAFYVPSDGNDNGYTGPVSTVVSYNNDASSTFHADYQTGGFAAASASGAGGTPPLTELWAFIPPGQLPLLQSNEAQVDSSPVVLDVFGDFNGTGLRSWHTVLVASAGGGNRELFALDVTNPLKPI